MSKNPPTTRHADYFFDGDHAHVTISFPVDLPGAFAPEDLALWVGELVEKTSALTSAYRLIHVPGVHLTAGADMQWQAAPGAMPELPLDLAPAKAVLSADRRYEAEEGERVAPISAAPAQSWLKREAEVQQVRLEAALARSGLAASGEPTPAADGRRRRIQRTPAQIEAECEAIYQVILHSGGERRAQEILHGLPPTMRPDDRNWIFDRLSRLKAAGRITSRKEAHTYQSPSYHRAVLPAGGSPAPREPALPDLPPKHEAVAQARALTQGKVMLFFGAHPGRGKQEWVERAQAALGLKELRWPDFTAHSKPPEKLKELEKGEVDFVVINRFNRRHMRHVAQRARECGIPVLYWSQGTNLVSLITQLLAGAAPLPAAS